MKAGISTANLFLREFNEEAISLLSSWGIQTAEVFFTTFSEYDPSFAKLLKERKGSLDINSVHVLNTQFEPQLFQNHPRVRGDAYMWLEKAMESAKLLGAKYYTFHGIARIKRSFHEDFDRFGRIAEIREFCKKFDIELCLENVEWAMYNRPSVFTEIKKRCEGLKGVLDIKQARISGYDYFEYLKEMGGDIAHVHVSDIDDMGHMRLPGQGTFDFPLLIKRLKDVGFDGALIIENYQDNFKEIGELKRSCEFLAEQIQRFG